MRVVKLQSAAAILVLVSSVGLCCSFHPASSSPSPCRNNNKLSNTVDENAINENEKKGPSQTLKRIRPRIPVVQYHDDWVCVNKPAGMTVHRTANTSRRQLVLATLLKRQLARKVFPVHRLDHRTSGAILFAFNSKTCGLLHKSLTFVTTCSSGIEEVDEDQPLPEESNKSYIALVRGDWKRKFESTEIVTVDKPLRVKNETKDAKTEFRLLASSPGDESERYSPAACSLILCTPKTGRTHQIRRHAHSMGFPIIGDSQHGDSKINRWWRRNRSLDRLFLHCLSLDLPPLSTFDDTKHKERIECIAPMPSELIHVLEHEDMRNLWKIAKGKDPRLTLEFTDERGGAFGRNYRSSKQN
jgi:tRNA pseudouridine65 synthase